MGWDGILGWEPSSRWGGGWGQAGGKLVVNWPRIIHGVAWALFLFRIYHF